MILSILIATIEARKLKLVKLLEHLEAQKVDGVEILTMCDNKEMNIGMKRQRLIEKAQGDYVCFIDDDDWVPDDYVAKILKGIAEGVDCIGFLVALDGWSNQRIVCSLSNRWGGWFENVGGFKYVRCPNHLSVIKRSICLQIGYTNVRCGEDSVFSLELKKQGLIKSEHFINEIMYEYRFDRFERNKY